MPRQAKQIATRLVVALVLLRLIIGCHFLNEGASKLGSGSFSSAGFLGNSHGPLAGWFHDRVWDADGLHRLGFVRLDDGGVDIDTEPTTQAWQQFAEGIVGHYGLDKEQAAEATKIVEVFTGQLDWYLDTNHDEIISYFRQVDRRTHQLESAALQQVSSLREQGDRLASENRLARITLVGGIDRIWSGLENDLNALGTARQPAASRLALGKLGRRSLDSVAIDKLIPYFDLLVGICLIIGLFTPVAASAGALFLLSVIVSQWPGSLGATPVYYQAIEMFGLVTLALASAGRYAGIDYFLLYLLRHRKAGKHPAVDSQGAEA